MIAKTKLQNGGLLNGVIEQIKWDILQNGARLKGVVEQIKWAITLLRRALNPDDAICILRK